MRPLPGAGSDRRARGLFDLIRLRHGKPIRLGTDDKFGVVRSANGYGRADAHLD